MSAPDNILNLRRDAMRLAVLPHTFRHSVPDIETHFFAVSVRDLSTCPEVSVRRHSFTWDCVALYGWLR